MNDMDEISFWISTKRAPCLFNTYDIISRTNSVPDESPSPKKKKRKLSILDDESVLSEKQNLYFDVSQIKNQTANGCESSTAGSDVDFNIKKSSVQEKRKSKQQKSGRTTLHKKNKLVTSTPKPQVLRRSLRKVQSSINNNTSYEIVNSSRHYISGTQMDTTTEMQSRKEKQRDQTVPNKQSRDIVAQPIAANDKYEGLSDVSGFTANYIRSTKIHSKTPRKVKTKTSRNLMKESYQSPKDESKMVVCVNKSVNTGLPQNPVLNCSTDSSQNVINLVTIKNNTKSDKVDKSTSLFKFIDSKNTDVNLDCSRETNLDSTCSKTSRYPKRNKTIINLVTIDEKPKIDKRKNNHNGAHLNRKENPNETKTRSGRSLGQTLRQKDNSVLVISNLEQSSTASVNVASATVPKNKKAPRQSQVRNSECSRRQSRDKSGFAKCFSDSDDGEPKQRKYFC